jgi:hypothetical protein
MGFTLKVTHKILPTMSFTPKVTHPTDGKSLYFFFLCYFFFSFKKKQSKMPPNMNRRIANEIKDVNKDEDAHLNIHVLDEANLCNLFLLFIYCC